MVIMATFEGLCFCLYLFIVFCLFVFAFISETIHFCNIFFFIRLKVHQLSYYGDRWIFLIMLSSPWILLSSCSLGWKWKYQKVVYNKLSIIFVFVYRGPAWLTWPPIFIGKLIFSKFRVFCRRFWVAFA